MSKKDEEKFSKWFNETWIPTLKPELHNSAKALFNDEEARTELMNGYLRTDDYTRKSQELARAREEAEAKGKDWETQQAAYHNWYQQANQQYLSQGQQLNALKAALNNSGYQQGQTPAQNTPAQDELLQTIQALQTRVESIDRGTYNAATGLSNLAYRAAKEGYSFDPAKIIDISTRQNLPLDRAFEDFIAPEKQVRDAAAREKEREEMKEQIRREIMSTRPGPDRFGPEPSPSTEALFRPSGEKQSSYDRVGEAVKEFYAGFDGKS